MTSHNNEIGPGRGHKFAHYADVPEGTTYEEVPGQEVSSKDEKVVKIPGGTPGVHGLGTIPLPEHEKTKHSHSKSEEEEEEELHPGPGHKFVHFKDVPEGVQYEEVEGQTGVSKDEKIVSIPSGTPGVTGLGPVRLPRKRTHHEKGHHKGHHHESHHKEGHHHESHKEGHHHESHKEGHHESHHKAGHHKEELHPGAGYKFAHLDDVPEGTRIIEKVTADKSDPIVKIPGGTPGVHGIGVVHIDEKEKEKSPDQDIIEGPGRGHKFAHLQDVPEGVPFERIANLDTDGDVEIEDTKKNGKRKHEDNEEEDNEKARKKVKGEEKDDEDEIVRIPSATPGVTPLGKIHTDHPLEYSEKEVK
jgi:hypothetical protein